MILKNNADQDSRESRLDTIQESLGQFQRSAQNFKVMSIQSKQTYEWLLYKHYAKRIPSISYAFGLYYKNKLEAILTIGKPPSPPLCIGICGKQYTEYVYELNRLCSNDDLPRNALSFFVSQILKRMSQMILVSYADISMGHIGYIYQSTNWIYTGLSDRRTEWRIKGSNKHSKSICDKYTTQEMRRNKNFEMIQRPRKHRYIYFLGKKKQTKKMKKKLRYKILPYPKGENKKYDASYKPVTQQELFI